MNWLGDAADGLMCRALLTSYGIEVEATQRLTSDADRPGEVACWAVGSVDERDFEVRLHHGVREVIRAQTATDVSEHCRAHELPAPVVIADVRGCLVSPTVDGGGYVVPVPGVPVSTTLSVGRARSAGALLGRLHHVLSGYPLPSPHPQDDQSVILAAPVDEVLVAVETGRQRASVRSAAEEQMQLAELSAQRAEDIHHHLAQARGAVPELTLHTVHGDFGQGRLWFVGEAITGLTGFRAPAGYPALELARLAFDPVTVASRDDWIDVAFAVIGAYRARHPYLPAAEIQGCADIALLALLTQTPRHPEGALQAWQATGQAVIRVAERLEELRTALARIAAGAGRIR
ncbi:aminoglycoside phosphotransferase/kinase family protein [Actinacidiphila rubida]|uniref:Aminoglycoside phosphotransferase domain-containing protein n=1 Tax=Actinacidiphila rubida TaxID=310780 RepID=A0A1H8TR78_9ACTN|nr:hypothetical protein [Actinacidiphila rubida]SEO93336.1 hypothetical protein SAMN05216267_105712 [Actinacidiphila rubida]